MLQVPNTQVRIRVVLVRNAKPTTTSLNINTLQAGNTQISNFQTMKTAERYEILFEPVHEISINVVCATSNASDQPAHTCSLIRAFASRLSIL